MNYMEEKKTYLGTGGTVLNVLDLETGERRPTTVQDIKDFALLADALDNIHFFMLPLYPNNIEATYVDINRFWWALSNTTKHIMGGVYTIDGIRNVIDIAERVAGGATELREQSKNSSLLRHSLLREIRSVYPQLDIIFKR